MVEMRVGRKIAILLSFLFDTKKVVLKDPFGFFKLCGVRRKELKFFGGVSCKWGEKNVLVGEFKKLP